MGMLRQLAFRLRAAPRAWPWFASVVCLLLATAGAGARWAVAGDPTPPFLPNLVAATQPVRVLTPSETSPRRASLASPGTRHYEYVFPDREIDVFDIDHGQRLVQRVSVPDAHAIRGVAISPTRHILYMAVGGRGGNDGNGALLAYDLVQDKIVWERSFPSGVDSPALTPDGSTLYLPTGENSPGDVWWVVDAVTGEVTGEIHGGTSPHNTIVSPDGKWVYLGPRNSNYLVVASTRTNKVVRRVGPLKGGVRPFTINGPQTLAYTTATGFLGFQVSSLHNGRVLYTESFSGFSWNPGTFAPSAPSHGVSLSPDNRRLWVVDAPNSFVHLFDVSGVPARAPRPLANVKLPQPMTGDETPCGEDCARDGWLQGSLDGRFLYVGDAGAVVNTRSRKVVAFLPALYNSRYLLELDWRHGLPVKTSTRSGLGYLH